MLSFSAMPSNNGQSTFYDVPVYFLNDSLTKNRFLHFFVSAKSRIIDPAGNSDYLLYRSARKRLSEIYNEFSFDRIIATSEPFSAAVLAADSPVRSVLYLMDPPERISNGTPTKYRDKLLTRVLEKNSVLFTTPFIHNGLMSHHINRSSKSNIIDVGFPMITRMSLQRSQKTFTHKISLLFSGWLCSDIRSPKYFLEILSRLDERFVVTFMGRECEKLTERFDFQTKAELITLPQQPYETALQAMADADIMINIGNSVPVHMPSKTLEYINTGKPFVNFYKMDACPTLYYTKRYPLCLNLSENDPDIESAAARFVEFCVENKGKTVDRAYIESEYADCTPEYIAKKILDALE